MATIDSLEKVLEEELKDIFNAENQLLKAIPKMAKKATFPELKAAFQGHLKETEGQVQRLEKIGEILEIKLSGKTCKAMKGLIEEGNEIMGEKFENSIFLDTMLIGAAQKVEHYEIAAYGTARAIAQQLGLNDVVELLQETLDEESATDEKLTALSEGEVLVAASEGDFEEEEDDTDTRPSADR